MKAIAIPDNKQIDQMPSLLSFFALSIGFSTTQALIRTDMSEEDTTMMSLNPWGCVGGKMGTRGRSLRGARGRTEFASKTKNAPSKRPKLDRLGPMVWPQSFFVELRRRLSAECDFGSLSVDDRHSKNPVITARYQQFTEITAAINKQYNTNVTVEAALGMRGPIMIDKGIKAHVTMLRDINEIVARYQAGEDVVDLSREKCYPPMGVFKRILLHRGMIEATVKAIVSRPSSDKLPLDRYLAARDIEQLKKAWAADANNPMNVIARAKTAAAAEARFVAWFRTLGVPFKTQEELAEEQIREVGRAVITPDILLLGDLVVEGVRLHWIDFKDYTGCPLPFIQRGCQEQAAKYTEKWGQGAFCFRGGYVAGFTVDLSETSPGKNPLVLSYRDE